MDKRLLLLFAGLVAIQFNGFSAAEVVSPHEITFIGGTVNAISCTLNR